MPKKKTHEEFVEQLNKIHGEGVYIPLEEYINIKTKILVRHNKCGCTWKVAPNSLLKNGCPVCANQKIVLGVNTIWDTDRWMVDLGISEEDAKKYSRGSEQKIIVKCPNCGKERKIRISAIYTYKSICCSCGDGKSYPEKFVFNLLEQLNVDFEIEYKPNWISNKRYDFYLKDINCIIETHGQQHYNKSFDKMSGKTLKQEQQNDEFKRETALVNGIKYYIELDCRESNLEYIKNSILNSELSQLFDLNNINWNKCAEFANKNIVKEVCNYWNNKREDETISDVGKIFKLNRHTILKYIKIGNEFGWCEYNRKEEIKKRKKKASIQSVKSNSKKVKIFKDNQSLGIFESCHELERQSERLFGVRLNYSSIASVCRNKKNQYKGYQFKYIENVA